MSQSIVFDSPSENTKCSADIKEEHLDAPSVTDIDNIKPASPFSTIKDEIDIKEEPLESTDESYLNVEMRTSDPLKSNSATLKVCGTHFLYLFF